jgi:hypothetical protein
MSSFLIKVFTLPQVTAAVVMAVLYSGVVYTLITKREFGKYFFPFFGIVCVVDFVISGIPREWMIVSIVGLLLCYELIEFTFLHDVTVGDEHLHRTLVKNHAAYLAVMFTTITAASFGTLFFFGRIGFRFSESVYINALIFSVLFLTVIYLLRYAST